ncbi:MAG: insulinase family protein, partial [Candidatus Gastranaerophilales bacterium]|nr:insulinase family protein [Candidatus Gastranaerophilales bacterium]
APAPVYTQIPYGIYQRNYIKLGVDKLPNGSEIHIYRLSNGQNVQIIKKEGSTSLLTRVNVGSFDEKGYPKGIAHFIEHSVYHGSKNHTGDLSNDLDRISTFSNASTSSKETKYYLDLADDSIEALNTALDMQSGMLLTPTFSQIEKEKPIVQAEYQRDMLDDFNLMYENLLKNLFQYSDTNEASICGNDETIASITKEDMQRFHQNFYKPSNMTTMIISKHNPDEIIDLVASNFISKSQKDFTQIVRYPVNLIDRTIRSDLITNNSSDGNVFLSFVCPNLNNGFEKLKLKALCSIFSSRYLDSMQLSMQNSSIGIVSCARAMNEDLKPNEAIQCLYQMINDFKSKPPTNAEIKEIKKDLLKKLDSSFNSGNIELMENILDEMNDNNNYTTYQAYKQMIEALTPQNIYEMVSCLDLNKAAVVVSHPKGSTKETIQEVDGKYPYSTTPIDISANSTTLNYQFIEHYNQTTGDKFYSTTLQDGSNVFFVNSADDNCRIDWRLTSENSYSSNPASKYILNYFSAIKLFNAALYAEQDQIDNIIDCELEDLENDILKIKSFSHLELTQKNLDDAKKEAIKTIDEMSVSAFEVFCQSIFGSKYTITKEQLKAQVEKLTLNDLVNDLNNMILNSKSSYVVKAPIVNNPSLMNEI